MKKPTSALAVSVPLSELRPRSEDLFAVLQTWVDSQRDRTASRYRVDRKGSGKHSVANMPIDQSETLI